MKGKILQRMLVFASLALLSSAAAAQISNTPHNLTAGGSGPNTTTGTDQICVFCHTPHGSSEDLVAPLWNKALPDSTSFTTYSTANSSTIDGGVLDVGSVSLACLSCHDGTQAMDNMFNAPGSGAGIGDGTEGVSQNYTWTGSNVVTGIANLGIDLTNDHPIGIEYCGGGITADTATTVTGTCGDLDFVTDDLKTASINGAQVFWVETGLGSGTQRDRQDIILYTRDFTSKGGAANTPSVECASCHDPHVQGTGSDVNFMRVTTAGSAICLACHVK